MSEDQEKQTTFEPTTLAVFGHEGTVVLAFGEMALRLTPDEAISLVQAITLIFAQWAGIEDPESALAALDGASLPAEVESIIDSALGK